MSLLFYRFFLNKNFKVKLWLRSKRLECMHSSLSAHILLCLNKSLLYRTTIISARLRITVTNLENNKRSCRTFFWFKNEKGKKRKNGKISCIRPKSFVHMMNYFGVENNQIKLNKRFENVCNWLRLDYLFAVKMKIWIKHWQEAVSLTTDSKC